jgi:hypothetical protein
MQISTSVGVVQDILISLSFQKNAKLIMDPSKSQDQPAGICVNSPAAELACRPSLRSSRASEANVPERAIAHRQKRADRRPLDAPSEGGHQPAFQGSHQATRPCLPGYSARLTGDTLEIVLILGLNQQPARSGPSGCSLRRCSSSRVPPPVSIHSPPTALFLGLLSSRYLAPVPPLGSLEMTSVFPCFCPSPY